MSWSQYHPYGGNSKGYHGSSYGYHGKGGGYGGYGGYSSNNKYNYNRLSPGKGQGKSFGKGLQDLSMPELIQQMKGKIQEQKDIAKFTAVFDENPVHNGPGTYSRFEHSENNKTGACDDQKQMLQNQMDSLRAELDRVKTLQHNQQARSSNDPPQSRDDCTSNKSYAELESTIADLKNELAAAARAMRPEEPLEYQYSTRKAPRTGSSVPHSRASAVKPEASAAPSTSNVRRTIGGLSTATPPSTTAVDRFITIQDHTAFADHWEIRLPKWPRKTKMTLESWIDYLLGVMTDEQLSQLVAKHPERERLTAETDLSSVIDKLYHLMILDGDEP
eukprot:TRINITY_DN16158_c0_g1_i1.p1 TRINITY_DN16158_c0_g1~~TRINITY_DN16158_c0_g1_i1.p1  ORF type:complete len:332 (-),score=58.02 TRINITY_DN16158_c0_g1_i1:338-1333(-)